MAKKKIIEIVAEELSIFLKENGFELYNIEFVKEGRDWILRVYIDMLDEHDNVSTEDCEKVSRYLSERLDGIDPIAHNYYLEVSSPGIERPLLKDSDFEKYKGRSVEASLYKGVDGVKVVKGKLLGLKDDMIIIADEKGKQWELPKKQVAKTRLAVVF